MTAINSKSYGVVYLTPNHLVDFTAGEAVIRWDVSSLSTSKRDWWDVWITPWEDNMALPIEPDFPDLAGPPRNAVQLKLGEGSRALCPQVYVNGLETLERRITCKWGDSVGDFLQPSSTARASWELRISATHIKGCLVSTNGGPVDDEDRPLPFCFFDLDIARLDWTQGVVQWGHHSYTPTKSCAGICGPNTWHWDNFSITPAVPFSMIKADQRFTNGGTVNFASPAPPNAYLRFAANGGRVEINDGTGWRSVAPRTPADGFLQASYFVPIASGTRSIDFRLSQAESWFAGPYIAKDLSIWSRD